MKKDDTKTNTKENKLRLFEKRKHPRFLLSRELFRETKTATNYSVYDLSVTGLSLKTPNPSWEKNTPIQGTLNLQVESIAVTLRLLDMYGDRAAFQMEGLSTYSRGVLIKALSPKRLGASLQLIKEKLPIADYWYHGVCNTDLLIQLNSQGEVAKAEIFFSNFYWCWHQGSEHLEKEMATGVCQSIGLEKKEALFLAEEPVKLESIDLSFDSSLDAEKISWAQQIIDSSRLDVPLKNFLLKKFETL